MAVAIGITISILAITGVIIGWWSDRRERLPPPDSKAKRNGTQAVP